MLTIEDRFLYSFSYSESKNAVLKHDKNLIEDENDYDYDDNIIAGCVLIFAIRELRHVQNFRFKRFNPYSKPSNRFTELFDVFKPVFIISICAVFLIMPKTDNPMVVYTLLIIVSLAAMLPIISRIPRRYVLSLRESVQRRNKLKSIHESLIDYKPNLILDQFKIARGHHNDMFSYL